MDGCPARDYRADMGFKIIGGVLTAVLGLAACGASGTSAGNPKACRAAWLKEDTAIGDAIMSGQPMPTPLFTPPSACAGLSAAQSAHIHAQLMANGN